MEYKIRMGYACINTDLRESDIFTSRSPILNTVKTKGFDYIKEIIIQNIDDLGRILIYNEAHGIRFFRISSCLFPHLGNPRLENSDYDLDFVKDRLKSIGKYAKAHKHRLSMHPGQFCQLGSPNPDVVKQTVIDLTNHAKLLDMLGYEPEDGSVLIVHGGGTFGNKEDALSRFKENYLKLPHKVRKYISLENDEFSYSVMDLLPFCESLNIPLCLDIFHNKISKDKVKITKKLMNRIFNTWKIRNMPPKIHISEQQVGLRLGSHSKTLDKIPLYVFMLPILCDTSLDIMLEVKDKEVSVFKMYYKYFDIEMGKNGSIDYKLKESTINTLKIKYPKFTHLLIG